MSWPVVIAAAEGKSDIYIYMYLYIHIYIYLYSCRASGNKRETHRKAIVASTCRPSALHLRVWGVGFSYRQSQVIAGPRACTLGFRVESCTLCQEYRRNTGLMKQKSRPSGSVGAISLVQCTRNIGPTPRHSTNIMW